MQWRCWTSWGRMRTTCRAVRRRPNTKRSWANSNVSSKSLSSTFVRQDPISRLPGLSDARLADPIYRDRPSGVRHSPHAPSRSPTATGPRWPRLERGREQRRRVHTPPAGQRFRPIPPVGDVHARRWNETVSGRSRRAQMSDPGEFTPIRLDTAALASTVQGRARPRVRVPPDGRSHRAPSAIALNTSSSIAARRAAVRRYAVSVSKISVGYRRSAPVMSGRDASDDLWSLQARRRDESPACAAAVQSTATVASCGRSRDEVPTRTR